MSYVPSVNLFGMLSDLGDSIGNNIKQYQQRQSLGELGNNLSSGNYPDAMKAAAKLGDLNTMMSLAKLGQTQQSNAAYNATIPGLFGSGDNSAQTQQGGAPSPSGAASAGVPAGDPSRGIMAFFQSKGLPVHSAAALAAQFKAESLGQSRRD